MVTFSAYTFQYGCLGKPGLCDSDATVVCEMNKTAPLLCECVYLSSSLNLPTCEDEEVEDEDEDKMQQLPLSNGKTINCNPQ